jgi:hypothetical protein
MKDPIKIVAVLVFVAGAIALATFAGINYMMSDIPAATRQVQEVHQQDEESPKAKHRKALQEEMARQDAAWRANRERIIEEGAAVKREVDSKWDDLDSRYNEALKNAPAFR